MEFIERVLYNLTEVHPIHTLFVHFPIALTGSALLFVLLALWKRNQNLDMVAFANITLASFSTIFAGATGLLDNIEIYGGDAPNAGAKVLLAISLFLVTGVLAYVRWRNPDLLLSSKRVFYVFAYVLGFLIASVLGFLGGVILYGF